MTLVLPFRPLLVWPAGWLDENRHRTRESSPFSAAYSKTLEILERELRMVDADLERCFLSVDAGPGGVRLDGQLRADAKVRHPGVILSIESRRLGRLTYATDRYLRPSYRDKDGADWHHNLRAIALGLEALRAVTRYGIADGGQQYTGYRELGAGTPLGPARPTVLEAARMIADAVDPGWLGDVNEDPLFALVLWRDAAKEHHPDRGGDGEVFRALTVAKEVLEEEARRTGRDPKELA